MNLIYIAFLLLLLWLVLRKRRKVMHNGLAVKRLYQEIYARLDAVLTELESQKLSDFVWPVGLLSREETLMQTREFLEAGEEGLAYDGITGLLLTAPYRLSADNVISLLEVGIMLEAEVDENGKITTVM